MKIKVRMFHIRRELPFLIFLLPGVVLAQDELYNSTTFYREAGSYGTRREVDPPAYTRRFSSCGKKDSVHWLEAGLDYRMRYEYRHNDLRRISSFNDDHPFLLRTRAYLGVKNLMDPLRFAVEFEDAQKVNGNYSDDSRDVNRYELIQGYAELYFERGLGSDERGNPRPVFLRAGRMAFEFLDRRLIASNAWRNTTNNFTGLRVSLGQEFNGWQIDLLAVRPVVRDIKKFDKNDPDRVFWAIIGHWRKWSDHITVEPYYLGLNQHPGIASDQRKRIIHSPGLRLYGKLSDRMNYDLTGTYQFGKDNSLDHNAYALTVEAGYYQEFWKTRVSLFSAIVSGDHYPSDKINNRFERFYGFSRPWSSDDYVIMENIRTVKLRVECEPQKEWRIDGGYGFFWLDSKYDRFGNLLAGSEANRDVSGRSGSFIGHGPDVRARYNPTKFLETTIGYSHFMTGLFVRYRQEAANGEGQFVRASNFAYVELLFNLLDLFSIIY